MEAIFSSLARAMEGSPALACGASLLWGILSIVLSPCHLASIPLIVGFIDGQGRTTTKRAFLTALSFSVGILVTIALVGLVTASLGRLLGDMGRWGNYFLAGFLVLFSLLLLDAIPMPWSGPGQVNMKRRGLLAAFILGLVFGIALGPCTFAFMAPVLAATFKLAAVNAPYAVLLLVLYGVGHCAVIVLAGTFTEAVQRYLNWNEKSRGAVMLKRACGVLVLAAGLYVLYIA